MALTLVLGGARSGKSMYAQRQAEVAAETHRGPLVLLATAQAFDAEMTERIQRHRQDRGEKWRTVETPVDLPRAITQLDNTDIAVVDCLTLWVSNLLMTKSDIQADMEALLTALAAKPNPMWVVSNEIGLGIVPDNALARRFRDECGRLHQQLAAHAENVVLLVAGLPMKVK